MEEYIERKKAKEVIAAYCAPIKNYIQTLALDELLTQIDVLPAVDVVEVRHGRIVDGECTACGWYGDCVDTPYYNYCPNCGVKLDKEET